MIIENHIKDIHPRLDKNSVMWMIERFLDSCDPDTRVDLVLETIEPTGQGPRHV